MEWMLVVFVAFSGTNSVSAAAPVSIEGIATKALCEKIKADALQQLRLPPPPPYGFFDSRAVCIQRK